MKKSVYFSGIACTLLLLLGCMFKTMHWPGANASLMASVFLFCFYFLPVALTQGYKSQETPKYRSLYIITYIVFAISVMSVLFRVLHWPGAAVFVLIGLPLPFVLFLPAYLYHTRLEKKENSSNFLGLMSGLIFLAVFSVLLVFGISRHVLRNGITRLYSIEQTRVFEEQALSKFKTESDVRKASDELCSFIEKLKDELLEATQGNIDPKIKVLTKYHWGMVNTDDRSATENILFNPGEKNMFEQLRAKVTKYHTALLATQKMSPELTELTNALFNVGSTRELNQEGLVEERDWEQREFANKQLVFVLGALSQIQSNLRVVELEYLASLK